jgi:hypothetical protein
VVAVGETARLVQVLLVAWISLDGKVIGKRQPERPASVIWTVPGDAFLPQNACWAFLNRKLIPSSPFGHLAAKVLLEEPAPTRKSRLMPCASTADLPIISPAATISNHYKRQTRDDKGIL